MLGPKDVRQRVELLERALADQRSLLAKYVNPNVERVPQIFVPYKEVLPLYRAGLNVPGDVTLVWQTRQPIPTGAAGTISSSSAGASTTHGLGD